MKHVETLDSDPVAVCLAPQIGDKDKASEYFRPAFSICVTSRRETLPHGIQDALVSKSPLTRSSSGRTIRQMRFEDELKPYSQSRTEGKVQWNSWAFVVKRICDGIHATSDLNLLDHRRHFGEVVAYVDPIQTSISLTVSIGMN